jgi:hypothetical protein
MATSVFANLTSPSVFEPSPAYRAIPAAKGLLRQRSDALAADAIALVDLGELGQTLRMVLPGSMRRSPLDRLGLDITYPERHRRLGDVECGRDVGKRHAPRAQLTSSRLRFDLPAIPHRSKIPTGCDSYDSSR